MADLKNSSLNFNLDPRDSAVKPQRFSQRNCTASHEDDERT